MKSITHSFNWPICMQMISKRRSSTLNRIYIRTGSGVGRSEKCAQHLFSVLGRPPAAALWPGQLARMWDRLSDPAFRHAPLDIFFVRIRARFISIRFPDLRRVRKGQGKLLIETRHGGASTVALFPLSSAACPLPLAGSAAAVG